MDALLYKDTLGDREPTLETGTTLRALSDIVGVFKANSSVDGRRTESETNIPAPYGQLVVSAYKGHRLHIQKPCVRG